MLKKRGEMIFPKASDEIYALCISYFFLSPQSLVGGILLYVNEAKQTLQEAEKKRFSNSTKLSIFHFPGTFLAISKKE